MSLSRVSLTNPVLRRTSWKGGPEADVEGPVLVSLTDFQVDGYRNLLRVVKAGLGLQRGWGDREGSVGLALWVQPLRQRLGSLSAWKSNDDLQQWVGSPEHLAIVRTHQGHMQNISSDSWQTDRFDVEAAWQEVARRWAAEGA